MTVQWGGEGKKKTCEETNKADASWGGHSSAFLSRHFLVWTKGDRKKRRINVKHH